MTWACPLIPYLAASDSSKPWQILLKTSLWLHQLFGTYSSFFPFQGSVRCYTCICQSHSHCRCSRLCHKVAGCAGTVRAQAPYAIYCFSEFPCASSNQTWRTSLVGFIPAVPQLFTLFLAGERSLHFQQIVTSGSNEAISWHYSRARRIVPPSPFILHLPCQNLQPHQPNLSWKERCSAPWYKNKLTDC